MSSDPSREKSGRPYSATSRHRRRVCPDPRVCPQCTDNGSCIYLLGQQKRELLDELLKIIERRVDLADTCLVNVRNLSRILGKKLDVDPKRISKAIDDILTHIRAEKWGHACSDYRLEKWSVRPLSSKIYQIDQATLESLRWYIDQVQFSSGGTK